MITKQIKLEFEESSATASVIAMACTHIGNSSMHEQGARKAIESCKSKVWVHLGDLIEAILPNDKRYRVGSSKQTLLNEIKAAQDWVKEANKTCIGIEEGNHEAKASNLVGNVTEMIAKNASVPNLGQTAFVKFACPSGSTVAFFAHSRITIGAMRSGTPLQIKGRKQEKIRNALRRFNADICVVGHGHQAVVAPPIYQKELGLDSKGALKYKPEEYDVKWCAMAPSMFMTYGDEANYAQGSLYDPTELGWIEILIERNGNIPAVRHILETGEVFDVYEKEIA